MNYIFVGCDSHDKTLVTKIALNRETAEKKRFGATRAGRRKLIEYFRRRSAEAGRAEVVVAYEASGNGFILCDELKQQGSFYSSCLEFLQIRGADLLTNLRKVAN